MRVDRITSDEEYQRAREHRDRFLASAAHLRAARPPSDVHPALYDAELRSYESVARDFQEQIDLWEAEHDAS